MSAESLLDWALQTSLSVSILIGLILLVRKPVARHLGAGAAYALWALPVIRLCLPAIPILPAAAPIAATPMPPGEFYAATVNTAPSESGLPATAVILVALWLGGACIWLIRQWAQQRQFRRHYETHTKPAIGHIKTSAANAASRLKLKKSPEIRIATDEAGPMVCGLLRPVVILPNSFENSFTAEQQTHALVHELSHVKNGDLAVSVAALLFRAVNWPNPLVHLAFPQFRADQEAACDARVITVLGDDRSTKTAYADTLIRAARLSRNPVTPLPVGLTMSNPLKERLMILKTNPTHKKSLRALLGGGAALALMATAPLTTAQTPPDTPDVPDTTITAKSVDKQVMKWVTEEDGISKSRHIEIVTEDGVTTAWEIDENGNKTELETSEIGDLPEFPQGLHGDSKTRIIMKKLGDGDAEFNLEQFLEGHEGVDLSEFADNLDGKKKVMIIERSEDFEIEGDGTNVFKFKSGEPGQSVFFSGEESGSAETWVNVAGHMLDKIDTGTVDRKARKKIEEARKALKEAEEALEKAK